MKIVVDTNVWISAIIKTNSNPALAVDFVYRQHTLLSSQDISDELQSVLARPYIHRYLTRKPRCG